VFENRVLRRIFGPRRDEVTGDWRKLHNEELHNFYSSPNIRMMRWAGHVARMGLRRNVHRILVRSGAGWGPMEGSCEHGNELSGSLKCWEVVERLHNWRLLKNG
jgi:hypothetical protein